MRAVVCGVKGRKDRRHKEIRFTDKGREYVEKVLHPMQEMDYKATETFALDEISNLTAMIEKCGNSFEQLLNEFIGGEHDA